MAFLLSERDDIPVLREGKLGCSRPFLRSLLSGGASLPRISDPHRANHRADLQPVAGRSDRRRPSMDRNLPDQPQDDHAASAASDPLCADHAPLRLVRLGAPLVFQSLPRKENGGDL